MGETEQNEAGEGAGEGVGRVVDSLPDAPTAGRAGIPPVGRPKHAPRHNWPAVQLEYMQGVEVDGAIVYPTLEDLAKKYDIPLRTINYQSGRRGWVAKREEYRRLFALDSHRARISKLLKEMERFDGQALAVAKAGMNEVLRIFNAVNVARAGGEDVVMGEAKLDRALQAAERAQKIGRLAMHLPTELTEAAKKVEDAQLTESGVAKSESVALKQAVEQLAKLEGDDYIRGLNAIFGLPPGGQPPAVIPGAEIPLAVRVLPEKASEPA